MTSTDLHHFLRTRRSVRRFTPQAVNGDTLQRILLSATFAPSAHHRQPWRFALLTTPGPKSRLAEAMAADFARDLAADGLPQPEIAARLARSRERIQAAPVVVILCLDMTDMDTQPDSLRQSREREMATQSVAAAGLQLMLSAHAEGLGSVWVCSPLFAPQTVRETLSMPASWDPQAMIFIGHPAAAPEPRPRKPLREIALFL